MLGKKVVIFHWDVYPTTMAGKRIGGNFRRLVDTLEKHITKLATAVVIPSSDFRGFVTHTHIIEMPIWPSTCPVEYKTFPSTVGKMRVAFVGQIHPTRGLADFVKFAREHISHPFELHLFAGGAELNPATVAMGLPAVTVIQYPRMDQADLQKHLVRMHLGLVSLSPDLDQPGFPSKTFDYVAANTPIIYFGRSLPGYCELLTDSSVGEVLDESNCDLAAIYQRLTGDWETARGRFYTKTRFDVERFFSGIALR